MRKLGLIGGTGPESTIAYYRALIEGVGKAVGEQQLPPLVIESLNAFRVLDYCAREDYDGLTSYLGEAIDDLVRAGAEIASLTALTPHIVFDRLVERSPIPLISAVEATRDEAMTIGAERLVLLGTEPTMTQDFFAQPLRDAGMQVFIPSDDEIAFIQGAIVGELEHGVVRGDTRERFVQIVLRLRDEFEVGHVILGCTELPLLLDDDCSPLPCLDPVEVHTRRLVSAITA